MNSTTPYSRSSIIYDVDLKNKTIIIAQPLTAFSRKTVFKDLHITTIIQEKNRKARFGLKCHEFELIDQYLLANKTRVQAVILKYELPITETNIRSAFRLPLSIKYVITAKILYENLEYKSPNDFSVRDISLNGIGIVIPKPKDKASSLFPDIKIDDEIALQIILIHTDMEKPLGILPIRAQLARMNPRYSSGHILMGLKITSLSNPNETILNKFIHDAQIEELKRLSRTD